MKIVVDTPEDYKAWLAGKQTIAEAVKADAASKQEAPAAPATPEVAPEEAPIKEADTTVVGS